MTQPAYVNVHGQPLSLSAKDAVLVREPRARSCKRKKGLWFVYVPRRGITEYDPWTQPLGSGATEEGAWREALSRMRIADAQEDARG